MVHVQRVFRTAILSCAIGAAACSNPTDADQKKSEPLNFYEEQLVGVWGRYHAYSGRYMFILFNANRTACEWEETSSSYTKLSYSSWTRWDVSETPTGSGEYRVNVPSSGLTQGYTFDYGYMELWPTTFDNLVYFPYSGARTCDG